MELKQTSDVLQVILNALLTVFIEKGLVSSGCFQLAVFFRLLTQIPRVLLVSHLINNDRVDQKFDLHPILQPIDGLEITFLFVDFVFGLVLSVLLLWADTHQDGYALLDEDGVRSI